jgi:hypothetical protein
LEISSTNKSYVRQFVLPQYNQPFDEWEKDLDNEKVEQTIPQYA